MLSLLKDSSSSRSFTRIPLNVPGELFASPMPYGRYDTEKVFRFFRQEEIQHVVVLLSDMEIKKRCRRDLKKLYARHNMEVTQFPMVDFLQPGHGDMDRLIPLLVERLRAGERMAVHCHAGVGRSTVVVACLVAVLENARLEECIDLVKQHMETKITSEQERFISGWIERLHEYGPDAPLILRSAELITTGSELLQGRTLNQHGFKLGGLLTSFGIPVCRETLIPDDPQAIEDAVLEAVSRCDLVIVTGGLGPTDDDHTLAAVASAFNMRITENREAEDHLTNFFVQLRRTPTVQQRRQAKVLGEAQVYMNPVGIAPGQRLTLSNSRHLWLLPGPPRELLGLINTAVRPWLETAVTRKDHHQAIFRLAGQSESVVQEKVQNMNNFREVDCAYCATPGSTELRFIGTQERVQELQEQTRTVFAEHLVNETGDVMEATVASLLQDLGQTVSVAESCTGGGLGDCLTSIPGASSFFPGGIISYSNEIKVSLLDVNPQTLERHGAVSAECAKEMALGVQKRFGSDWGISITGVAGPGGGSADKPIGLFYVGIAGPHGITCRHHQVGGDRDQIREHAVQRALVALWREL